MSTVKADILAKNLVRLLDQMLEQYRAMLALMSTKLEAMRGADPAAIDSITAREADLAARVKERDGLRRQLMHHTLAALELDPKAHAEMRVRDLAEYFAEPLRSQLLVKAVALKETLEEIEQKRTRTELITREMLSHFKAVFTVMVSGGKGDSYSRTGGRAENGPANVFEAVG